MKILKRLLAREPNDPAIVGKLIRVCPGKRHAWFESNVGEIRKPYTP